LFVAAAAISISTAAERFVALQNQIATNSEATRVLLEISSLRGETKESILLFRLRQDPRDLQELERLETLRGQRSQYLETLVRKLDHRALQLDGFFAGTQDTAELRHRIVSAIQARDMKRADRLFEGYSTLYDLSTARLSDLLAFLRVGLMDSELENRSLLNIVTRTAPVGILILIALVWFMIRFYRRNVLQPLGRLHQGLREVASGHLGHLIRTGAAPTEMRDMLEGFNSMTTTLEKTTKELTRAREEALIAAEAKSEFLANMSHEIRTPLNVIVGVADLISEQPVSSEAKKQIEIVKNSSHILLNVVNDILDYSRLESGRVTLAKEPYDPSATIERLVEIFAPVASERGLQLQMKFEPGIPRVAIGDALRLEQIILNLVNNAIKFTPRGTVTVEAGMNSASRLVIRVRDTGIGISSEAAARLFTRFTQVNSSLTRSHGGTGLGLAIIKQLTQLMGGEVSVESEPGVGSVFTVSVPLETAAANVEAVGRGNVQKPDVRVRAIRQGLRVLVVDDSPENRGLIKLYLRDSGAEITEAINGREAVELFKQRMFDVVLMDIQMPEVDGYDATRMIRRWESERGRVKRTPIIALTAFALEAEVQRSLDAGFDAHMSKPILKAELLRQVADYQPEVQQ
jgi:signal transduction histidine kinase/ActR/RegA family two-component response regulator